MDLTSHRSYALLLSLLLLLIPQDLGAESRGIAVKPISPTGEEITGDQWLLVIGIDTYIEWPRLQTAVADAKAVRDVLLSRYHFDKGQLVELYDEQATRKGIIGALRDLAQTVKEDDSLVIYYAGHGHLDSITRKGSWIPVESGTEEASAWISNNDIKEYLKIDAIKARHVLLISDSCFSGDFFRGHRGKLPVITDKALERAYRLSSRQAVTSGGLEPVSDAGFGRNSVFSHFLVRALKENQKPFLVPSDFFPDIRAGVAENAEQFPQFGSLKGTGGQQGGELVLFLKQGSRAKELAADAMAKSNELARLKRMEEEAEMAEQREAGEIAEREREVAVLDAQIADMKERLGTAGAKSDDNLDSMLAMIQQKEERAQRLEKLKQNRDEEARIRLAAIERLKRERAQKDRRAFEEDIQKYESIVSSPYGEDLKETAWDSLVSRHPEAKELSVGDVETIRLLAKGERYFPVRPFTDKATGMEFVFVKGWCYRMGNTFQDHNHDGDEWPVHEVCVGDFYIGKYEVTQAQWKKIMESNPAKFKDCGDDCPIEVISRNDIQAFIESLNRQTDGGYRLPSEAEWEYACRSGGRREEYSGGWGPDDAGWHYHNSGQKPHRVGMKSPNGLGIYDMSGNVSEWVQDRYDKNAYGKHSRCNPVYESDAGRWVARGGNWNVYAEHMRCADRDDRFYDNPDFRYEELGFRLVRDP